MTGWPDYLIVASMALFLLGWGWEGWNGITQTFIKNRLFFVAVNATGFVLLITGLVYQDYTATDGGLEVFSHIWTAITRVFGASAP